MIITPFLFLIFEIPPTRERSITRNTLRIRLVRGRRSLERNSYDSRPWAGGQNRRVSIPQHKAQREGDDLAESGNNSKIRRWTIKICWRRSGSENIHLDRGQRTQDEEKFKKTFLENQTGFHQPPKQEVVAHQHSLYREQCYPHQKIAPKNIWENLSWTSSTSRFTPSTTGKTSCFHGSWFINEFFLTLALFNIHDTSRQEIDHPTSYSSSSTSPTTTVSSDSEPRAREDLSGIDSHRVSVSSGHVERQERGDPCSSGIPEEALLTDPTNQAMST